MYWNYFGRKKQLQVGNIVFVLDDVVESIYIVDSYIDFGQFD